ncbi:hypothetical protein [Mesobacillus selenatarsenatis]|uniref:Type IV pilus biogenesis protein PilO n=1 Tax=Mesobacillus selenatarsenatis (strain DSM 18680 / JCM 14380 / FERM P-15431 / SF-1) TaxID=1321606 RepID=A0A0A8WWR8_MESS1|nr:hypothetical protein [Mesobacillus selenatarsenatis]GAM12063.1 type IV pilus biogenesis protein PilO [Mesobacillus selenatarsenatis SF-1]
MNLRLERKHYLILLAAALLSFLIYIAGFYLYLAPMNASLSLKESQLKMEKQLNSTLEERLASVNETDFSSSAELQKRLPVDPMVEQLVLDIEKAEVISNSFVTSIEFDASQQASPTIKPELSASEQVTDESGGQADNSVSEVEVTNPQLEMPDGLVKTTAQINVRADNYFSLEKFISALESLRRIVVVESISFSGPQEIFTLSDEEAPIEMALTINAFYFPELAELKDYNPKIETPAPANKRNPFPTFGDYSEDNLLEEEQSEVDETQGTNEN